MYLIIDTSIYVIALSCKHFTGKFNVANAVKDNVDIYNFCW